MQRQSAQAIAACEGLAPAAETALSSDSRQLLHAWKAWRGERLLPHRRDMDLVSIARLMPKMTLLEAFSVQRMIFRLAGGDIEALVGMRLMGRDHIALAEPEHRAVRGRLLWTAVSQPCGLVSFHTFPHPSSGEPHLIESFALPILPDEADAPIQLLGVVSRLPIVDDGASTIVPLAQIAATRQFIDIGAGIPAAPTA